MLPEWHVVLMEIAVRFCLHLREPYGAEGHKRQEQKALFRNTCLCGAKLKIRTQTSFAGYAPHVNISTHSRQDNM